MDHGQIEVENVGWWRWFLGQPPRRVIVREADIDAARQNLPPGANVTMVDGNGNYLLYEMPGGEVRIRFRASAAWLPNEPTIISNNSLVTGATLLADGRVLVFEGLHRTRLMARDRLMVHPKLGGVEQAPGWLDFIFEPEQGMQSNSSVQMGEPVKPISAK